MENKIRSTLNNIYFGKTRDIVNRLRSIDTLQDPAQKAAFQADIRNAILNRPQAQWFYIRLWAFSFCLCKYIAPFTHWE